MELIKSTFSPNDADRERQTGRRLLLYSQVSNYCFKVIFQLSYADDAVGRTNNRHCSLIVPLSWLKVVAVIVGAVAG